MSLRKLTLSVIWMTAICSAAEPGLRVVVYDYASMPPASLKVAIKTAQNAFRMAKFDTAWSVCQVSQDSSRHCDHPPAGTYVQVKVLPRMDKDVDFGQTDKTIGLALRTKGDLSAVSYIFYEAVKKLAENNDQDVSMVVGHVIAHEIGHLLGIDHHPSGIMKAKFERCDLLDAAQGRLSFLSEDGRKMREAAVAVTFAAPFTSGSEW